MDTQVHVEGYRTPGIFDTIVVFYGKDDEGNRVTFGVDHRMAWDLAQAVDLEEGPVAEVPEWALLGRGGVT